MSVWHEYKIFISTITPPKYRPLLFGKYFELAMFLYVLLFCFVLLIIYFW